MDALQRARDLEANDIVNTGTYSPYGERLSWSYYDTLSIPAAGIGSFRMLVDPVGAGGKTYADTNMTSRGIPKAQKFIVHAIRPMFNVRASTLTDAQVQAWNTFLDQSVVTIRVVGKDALFQVTAQELWQSSIQGNTLTPIAGNVSMMMGYGSVPPAYVLNIPLIFSEQTTPEIDLDIYTAVVPLQGMRVRFSLCGKLARRS